MTTVGDRLYELGGIPVGVGANGGFPCVGKIWWVDGTNGLDSNPGRKPGRAKKTIQAAVTAQIAGTSALGDIIYVLPGTYAESITGNLSQCKLIGYHPFAVRVKPTDGHAYSGNLHDAQISGFMFDNGSSTNQDYAAVRCTTVEDSVITHNLFGKQGGNDSGSAGFMLGTYATASTTVKFHRSVFSHNHILSNGGSNTFHYGFCMGSGSDDATNANARTMWNSRIEYNIIAGRSQGIRLITNYAGNYGSVIRGNVIMGDCENHNETESFGIYALDDTNATKLSRIWVLDNRVSSDTDAIKGFTVQLTQGNIVAVGGVGTSTPSDETIAN